jgi:formate dehydrogenase major subunit
MVNLTIDGKSIQVPDGTSVLHAAQSAGIQIPTLCDHPKVTPYGGCRLCLVEIEGARTLQPSCTLPVSPNMVVRTNTEKVLGARKFVLTMLFSERNHFCPYCQVSGGDCELQNAAYAEGMDHWPLQPNWQPFGMDASHPYIILEHNRCILCRRCVRACSELVGNHTLGFEERGAKSFLVADLGTPLGESSCVSCGTCVQICPTGALIDRWSAYRGRETQVDSTRSICLGCSVGCGINILTRDGSLVRIEGDWDAKLNDGVICKTGRFLPMSDQHDRITTPLVRKDGKLKAATWEEAFNVITTKMKPLTGKPDDGVAAVASTRLPVEALATFRQVFVSGMKSNMVTTTEEGATTRSGSIVSGSRKKAFEGKLSDILSADVIVLVNADVVNDHEVAGFFVKRAKTAGAHLIVVDTSANPLDELADMTIKASKVDASDVLAAFADAQGQPGKPKTGATAEAAAVIAHAGNPVYVYGKGSSTDSVIALVELAKVTHGSVINLKGQANSFAAAQLGLDQSFKLNGG